MHAFSLHCIVTCSDKTSVLPHLPGQRCIANCDACLQCGAGSGTNASRKVNQNVVQTSMSATQKMNSYAHRMASGCRAERLKIERNVSAICLKSKCRGGWLIDSTREQAQWPGRWAILPFVVADSLECDSSRRCSDALQTGRSTDASSPLSTKHNWYDTLNFSKKLEQTFAIL